MKIAIYILLTITFLLPILGCGSFNAHCDIPMSCQVGDPRYRAPTPIYGGVAIDCYGMMDCLKAPFPGIKTHSGDEWWVIFFFPLAIVDMPLSFLFDTIALPWDIEFWPKWSEAKGNRRQWDEKQEALKKEKNKTSEPIHSPNGETPQEMP